MQLDDLQTSEHIATLFKKGNWKQLNEHERVYELAQFSAAFVSVQRNTERYVVGQRSAFAAMSTFAKLHSAYNCWHTLRKTNLRITRRLAAPLLLAYALRGELEGIAKVRSVMANEDIAPSFPHYHIVAKGLQAAGAPISATLQLIQHVNELHAHSQVNENVAVVLEDPHRSKLLICAMEQVTRQEELKEVLRRFSAAGVASSPEWVRATLLAYAATGRTRESRRLVEQNGFTRLSHPVEFNIMTAAAIPAGKLRFAKDHLRGCIRQLRTSESDAANKQVQGLLVYYIHLCKLHAKGPTTLLAAFMTECIEIYVKDEEIAANMRSDLKLWRAILHAYVKLGALHVFEHMLTLYSKTFKSLPKELAYFYKRACTEYHKHCDGPFCIDAATAEDHAHWKAQPFPPHNTVGREYF